MLEQKTLRPESSAGRTAPTSRPERTDAPRKGFPVHIRAHCTYAALVIMFLAKTMCRSAGY